MIINYPDYKGYKISSDKYNTRFYVRKSDGSSWGDYTVHGNKLKDVKSFIDKMINDNNNDSYEIDEEE